MKYLNGLNYSKENFSFADLICWSHIVHIKFLFVKVKLPNVAVYWFMTIIVI